MKTKNLEIRNLEIKGSWSAVSNPEGWRSNRELIHLVGVLGLGVNVRITEPYTHINEPSEISNK
jgi:hypothetical protein